jgi:hypothetical protein
VGLSAGERALRHLKTARVLSRRRETKIL